MLNAKEIIRLLSLRPVEGEGGHFVETWRAADIELPSPAAHAGRRQAIGTAIYYLVTPESFSALHRLRSDEVFHFYLGDPCQMLLLHPDGVTVTPVLGPDLAAGMRPQVLAPAGVWQGTRLVGGGAWALLGTTMAPGFHPEDFELADRDEILSAFPSQRQLIESYLAR